MFLDMKKKLACENSFCPNLVHDTPRVISSRHSSLQVVQFGLHARMPEISSKPIFAPPPPPDECRFRIKDSSISNSRKIGMQDFFGSKAQNFLLAPLKLDILAFFRTFAPPPSNFLEILGHASPKVFLLRRPQMGAKEARKNGALSSLGDSYNGSLSQPDAPLLQGKCFVTKTFISQNAVKFFEKTSTN